MQASPAFRRGRRSTLATVACLLVALSGVSLTGCQTAGDKAQDKTDRAAQRTEGRLDQKTDQAIDRGLDRLLD